MTHWRSRDHNAEGCPGCRPVVFDLQTRKLSEEQTARALRAWGKTTPEEKRAWHRVTCLNSTGPIDMALAKRVIDKIERESLQ